MATEERIHDEPEKEHLYKTKAIQFLGRTTPIILQNDNGPCPLLAICNVLLLKNNLNLSFDASEVPLQKLLSLVAERLIDSNSNTENKEAGYLENQEQNIADAIDLLPRLATGIDVNVQFRKIDDFEFTRECAIFDLLDMPLYHGWIVDPQDTHTANAIGSKSYNTLMGELVALETRHSEEMKKSNSEDDGVDFAAATTATLGVPSPCLSRAMSFNDSPRSETGQKVRKGDLQEEAELLEALELSNVKLLNSCDGSSPDETSIHSKSFETGADTNMLEVHPEGHQQIYQPEKSKKLDTNASGSCNIGLQSSEISSLELEKDDSSSEVSSGSYLQQSSCSEPVEHSVSSDMKEQCSSTGLVQEQTTPSFNPQEDSSTAFKDGKDVSSEDQLNQDTCLQASTSSTHPEQEDRQHNCDETAFPGTSATQTSSDLSDGARENVDVAKSDTSSPVDSEPIYEGEDRILDSGVTAYESREPMYEGEVILAEQAEKGICEVQPQCDISQEQGELISSFLRNNASQLTIYGLFCLQEGLKERELAVFFRNNHFSTMFKYNGELYLLATDQGYINQPDLVWEKLNEVNGDTVFMTGNFTEFKVDNNSSETWDQQEAIANTADYIASIDNSTPTGSTFNSDLQLALALQQQEFGDQPQRNQSSQQQQPIQPSSGSQLWRGTGPQPQRPPNASHPTSSKQEAKSSKEKCCVM